MLTSTSSQTNTPTRLDENPLPLNKSHLVQDDFLTEAEFSEVQSATQRLEFSKSESWLNAWNIQSPQTWRSSEIVYEGTRKTTDANKAKLYPTGSKIDIFFHRLINNAAFKQRFGNAFSARVYLHPPGSLLDWHVDSGRYIGAFTYYAHPSWDISWGGEMMILEPRYQEIRSDSGASLKKPIEHAFTEDRINRQKLSQLILGSKHTTQFIFPKPNRLVFINPGYLHRVNPTMPFASLPRCSITGFCFF